jgi:hypothetical protein
MNRQLYKHKLIVLLSIEFPFANTNLCCRFNFAEKQVKEREYAGPFSVFGSP